MRTAIGVHEREIRHLAFWDRLTDLPNRLQFRDAVQAELSAGRPTAVIMLDLDRFKHVNDVLGYAFGDRLLKALGQRLQAAARPGDLVARLGGDEFALLLSDADAATAQRVAAQLLQALSQPLSLEDQRVDLGAGLGMACAPEHANDADTLLSRAEVAMYAAKRGKAGARLYEPALDNASVQTLSLLSELREAVSGGQLRLFVQPKMRVDTGELCGGEALVRWMHPTRGLVPPMQFIPFAEQTGFIRELTLWVFEEAARQQSRLRACGVKRLSLNLSTRDLMDIELPERFAALLQRHGARAEELCLEITESAIMDDPERAEATLNRLAGCGYKLSIDDFGTGYSSLAYLRRLPVQELKIDKSFVMSMQAEAGQAQIVRSTIDLAHNLGLSVVAEGVENAAIMTLLNELHCDEAQGYHLGKPMPLEQFEQRFGPPVATPSAVEPAAPATAPREVSPA
jgi:diguanylate cyclase (GGDEF)-like protein